MDNLESSTPATGDLAELRSQYNQLQQLVSSLLLVVIVISGTFSVFLWRQYRFVKAELDAVTPQAAQIATEYTNSAPMIQEFAKKLGEYGRTHPDFAPIVAKYHLNDLLAKPGTAAVTSSLPASASSKK
jgi:hypothetical protein